MPHDEPEAAFASLDLLQLMKDVFYGGFDTYEDYVVYGDAFVRLAPVPPRPLLMLPPRRES